MSMSISFKSNVTDEVKTKEKQNAKVSSFSGTLAALTVGGAVHKIAPIPLASPILKSMRKQDTFNKEEGKAAHNALKQMLKETGLKDKGVRIKFLSPKIRPMREKDIVNKFYKFYIDNLYINTVKKGQNAFFLNKDLKLPKSIDFHRYMQAINNGDKKTAKEILNEAKNKVVYIKKNSVLLSQNKMHGAGFHELGHAMNYNLSKFGKILQKCRPVAMLAPITLGIYGAVTKKSKPTTEGGELNKKQKVNNFLRDNGGKLAFLASIPMLLEEGMATIKGQQFAKKLLQPDLAKKVLKGNLIAYSTYLLAATAGALAVTSAVKIKDKAIAKEEAKAIEKANNQAKMS